MVSPCANCKKELREICEGNGLDHVQVVGLHDLVLKVLDFGAAPVQARDAAEPAADEERCLAKADA